MLTPMAIAIANLTASGVILWQDVEAGMSLPQVQALLPRGSLSLVYRDPCWLVGDLPVGRYRYDACVFLRNGKVQKIVLKNQVTEGYSELKQLLKGRYGNESREKCDLDSCSLVWEIDGVTITAMNYRKASVRTVTVRFEPR